MEDKLYGVTCDYDGDGKNESTCYKGQCPSPTDIDRPCLDNSDCGDPGSGYYCYFQNVVNCVMDNREALGCEAGQNIEECNPFDGYASRNVYCKAVPEGRLEANIPGLGTVYMVPTSTYGWFWSQRNLCQKWGKDLIPVEKLRIYRDSTSDSIHGEYLYTQGGGQEAVFACAEGKSCYPWNQAPYNAMWDGDTLTDAKDENGELYSAKFSPIVVALREAFGSRKVFLRTDSGIPPIRHTLALGWFSTLAMPWSTQ